MIAGNWSMSMASNSGHDYNDKLLEPGQQPATGFKKFVIVIMT
jgi:hypothetical protein